MTDERELATEVIRSWNEQRDKLGVYMIYCQEVANYILPNRADYIVERTPGGKRMQWIFNCTPVWALQQSAAGLHAYLTSPYLPWFMVHDDDDRVDKNWQARAWYDAATAAMYKYFSGPRHNFANIQHESYLDVLSVGTAVTTVLESERNGIFFSCRHLKECAWAENEEGRVDALSRRWQFTAKQAFQQWGPDAGEKVRKALADNKPDVKFWFHHRVRPRLDRDAQRADARNKRFESIYVGEADMNVISEGGFDGFPYILKRFSKVSGEINGRGPGTEYLPEIKMLNEWTKIILKGAQKVVDPALQLPDDGYIVPIRQTPGSYNYYRAGTRPTDRIMPIETKGNIQLGLEMTNLSREQIQRGFFVDYLMMPSDLQDPASSGKGVTATWTLQQRDEKMRLLSPMLGRMRSEDSDPTLGRVYQILWKQSLARRFGPGSPFPPPPDILRGRRCHAEYLSPIDIAQKSASLDPIKKLMQTQLELKQIDPNAQMLLDGEAIMRLEAFDTNAPAAALKSPERLKAEGEAAARMQQQQHEAEMASQLAGAAQQGTGAVSNLAQAQQQQRVPA